MLRGLRAPPRTPPPPPHLQAGGGGLSAAPLSTAVLRACHQLSDRRWVGQHGLQYHRVGSWLPCQHNLDELVSAFIQLDLQIVLPQASLQFTTSKAKVEGHKEPDLHYQHLWLLVSQEYVHHLFKILHCDDRLMRHCLELTIPLMLLEDAIQCVVCTCKFNVEVNARYFAK